MTLQDILAQLYAATPSRMPLPQIDLRAQRPPAQPLINLPALLNMSGTTLPAPPIVRPQADTAFQAFGAPPADTAGATGGFDLPSFTDILSKAATAGTQAPLPFGLNPTKSAATSTPAAAAPFAWQTAGTPGQSQSITINADGSTGTPSVPEVIAGYLPKMYGGESGNKNVPNAAGASSASGWAQFTDGTWLDTVKKHDPETYKNLSEEEVLGLRDNEKYHKQMAAAFTMDNAKTLQQKGLPINDGSLYAMHFFGQGDGPKVLSADPNKPLADVVSSDTIAANPFLKGMTVGQAQAWAAGAMNKQGAQAGGMPRAPNIGAPSLPIPPDIQPGAPFDTTAFDAFAKAKPTVIAPLSTADRVANLLGSMAAGAQGGKNWADVLLGAGAGAGKGAMQNVQQGREEEFRNAEAQRAFQLMLASTGVQKAGATQSNQNLQITAANQSATRRFETATQQAQMDTAAANKAKELQFNLDLQKWQMGQPQVHYGEDGNVTVFRKDPDTGSTTIKTVNLLGSDGLKSLTKNAEAVSKLFGDKQTPLRGQFEAMGIDTIAKKAFPTDPVAQAAYAKELATADVMRSAVQQGALASIFPKDQYDTLIKEAEKGLDPKLLASDAKGYNAQKEERLVALLNAARAKNPAVFDQLVIPYMATKGNSATAARLMPRG
jgi:hypothetical protein